MLSWLASEGGSSWDIEVGFLKSPLAGVGGLEAAGAGAAPKPWGRGPYCSLQSGHVGWTVTCAGRSGSSQPAGVTRGQFPRLPEPLDPEGLDPDLRFALVFSMKTKTTVPKSGLSEKGWNSGC